MFNANPYLIKWGSWRGPHSKKKGGPELTQAQKDENFLYNAILRYPEVDKFLNELEPRLRAQVVEWNRKREEKASSTGATLAATRINKFGRLPKAHNETKNQPQLTQAQKDENLLYKAVLRYSEHDEFLDTLGEG